MWWMELALDTLGGMQNNFLIVKFSGHPGDHNQQQVLEDNFVQIVSHEYCKFLSTYGAFEHLFSRIFSLLKYR